MSTKSGIIKSIGSQEHSIFALSRQNSFLLQNKSLPLGTDHCIAACSTHFTRARQVAESRALTLEAPLCARPAEYGAIIIKKLMRIACVELLKGLAAVQHDNERNA